jgi:hypothetical protein
MFDDEKTSAGEAVEQVLQEEVTQVEQTILEPEEVTPEQQELDGSIPYALQQEAKTRPVSPRVGKSEAAERNFRAMEDKMRRIERERDEALRIAQEKMAPVQQEEPDEDVLPIGDEDISEGKHLKSYYRVMDRKIKQLEEKLKKSEQASTAMSAEAMLKAQYPDIEKVVTKENLDSLRDADPDFAEVLDTSTSFRAKAISAYKHIKKLGLYTEDTYMADREKAKVNAAKPKPLASVSPQQGDSPLSRANAFVNGLTPELQKQLQKEMAEARKNR